MKPWTPYWKTLEKQILTAANYLPPPPFDYPTGIAEWISKLTFLDLMRCDFLCASHGDTMVLDLTLKSLCAEDSGLAWQWVLRLHYGVDFCRGNIGKRKDYDWSQPAETVYRFLLIDLWRSDAIYWANRKAGKTSSWVRLSAEANLHKYLIRKGARLGLN